MDIQNTSYKFLVTGGGGYIGFHVGLALVQLKQEVVLFDIKYPSKIWDPSIEISSVSSEDGELVEEQIRCSYGTMKFVKGNHLSFYRQTILKQLNFLERRYKKHSPTPQSNWERNMRHSFRLVF